MSDLSYQWITNICLWIGVASAFIYDHGWHGLGADLAIMAGGISIITWFVEGHK